MATTGTLIAQKDGSIWLGQPPPVNAVIDSMRISNTSRYALPFTAPSSKFSNDASTLALINFDKLNGPLVGVDTANRQAWAVQGYRGFDAGGVSINNINFVLPGGYGGISAQGMIASTLSNISWNGGRYGFWQTGNGFFTQLNGFNGIGTQDFGIFAAVNGGSWIANNPRVNSGYFPIWVAVNEATIRDAQVTPDNSTVFPIAFTNSGGPNTLINPFIDVEGTFTSMLADVYLAGQSAIFGGQLVGVGVPLVYQTDGGSAVFDGVDFMPFGSPAEVVYVYLPRGNSNVTIAGSTLPSFFSVPWSNTPNLAVVGSSSGGTVGSTFNGPVSGTGSFDFSGGTLKQPATYSSGSATITNPSASGTLALTSALPLSGSAMIGGSAIPSGSCSDAEGTIAVAGATTGMAASVARGGALAAGWSSLTWTAYVSAPGTVTVHACNPTTASVTPAAMTFQARVVQ